MASINADYLIEAQPHDIPNLVSFWDFQESATSFTAAQGEAYTLSSQVGSLSVNDDVTAPFGGKALHLEEGQWLNCARAACPKLDIHGKDGQLTVVTWIKRGQKSNGECEFLAGQWNESNLGRQYGLFLNIGVWGEHEQICGHLSHVGGPTPGYKYCVDGAMGATPIRRDEWVMIAMSYDGYQAYAWLDGKLDLRDGLNPYSMAGGLHDGGPDGSDFTVGAVDRSGVIGNFFVGDIAGLAVYDRALTAGELIALAKM